MASTAPRIAGQYRQGGHMIHAISTGRRAAIWSLALVSATILFAASAMAEIRYKVTLDTGANHIRNITVRAFIDKVKEATKGEVVGELFESGQLYSTRDEARAVARGDVDMAVSTTTSLAAFEPNMALMELPIFAGIAPATANGLVDGDLGQTLAKRLEERLGVIVPGRWLLLGFVHSYGGRKELATFTDFAGARIRIPGGPAYAARLKALGANPVSMTFGDVPLALSQGTIDGLLTTDETIRSGKLVEAGVKYGLVDYVSPLYYVPIMNPKFINGLKPEHRKIVLDTWNSLIDGERTEAMVRQTAARQENTAAGIKYSEPSPATLAEVRSKLMQTLPALVEELKLDKALVDQAQKIAAAAR